MVFCAIGSGGSNYSDMALLLLPAQNGISCDNEKKLIVVEVSNTAKSLTADGMVRRQRGWTALSISGRR